jgi:hypothetical protein
MEESKGCNVKIELYADKENTGQPFQGTNINNLRNGEGKADKPEFVWWNSEYDKTIRIKNAKVLTWKYCKTKVIILETKRAATNARKTVKLNMRIGKTSARDCIKFKNAILGRCNTDHN